jgi:DNA-binding response OmpR family regulator
MLVDDEPDIAQIMAFILTNAGFETVWVEDPRQAVPQLLAEDHALLVLDLMMPEMDGFQLLAAVRGEPKLATLPVLILSCRLLSQSETALLSSRRAEMMSKPFESHRLLEKVREMIAE